MNGLRATPRRSFVGRNRAYLSPFGTVKAYSLLLPMPGAMLRYPDPQYTVPFTIDGASITEPPLAKLNNTAPVLACSAYIAPEDDPANITPLATLTAPGSTAPAVGSPLCQMMRPSRPSSAAHAPH